MSTPVASRSTVQAMKQRSPSRAWAQQLGAALGGALEGVVVLGHAALAMHQRA
jgi:hypothetical protein